MSFFQVRNLSRHFGGLKAVDNVSFELEKGTICSLIGPNGAGKTTLFNLITGFIRPSQGKVVFDGKEVTRMLPNQIEQLGIARSFQGVRLFPQISVFENLLLACRYEKGEKLSAALFRSQRMRNEEEENKTTVETLLNLIDMAPKRDALAKNLSYGQKKLVEIAKVIATGAQLIFLDEITSGLFPNTAKKILTIVKGLQKQGKTIFFIEHDIQTVINISEKIIVLNHGQKIAEGPPEAIRQSDFVADAFLGRRRKSVV